MPGLRPIFTPLTEESWSMSSGERLAAMSISPRASAARRLEFSVMTR